MLHGYTRQRSTIGSFSATAGLLVVLLVHYRDVIYYVQLLITVWTERVNILSVNPPLSRAVAALDSDERRGQGMTKSFLMRVSLPALDLDL